MLLRSIAQGGALVLALVGSAGAAAEDTLSRLRANAVISLGANDDAMPLAYLHRDRHIGYQLDICARVVESVRRHLSLAELRVVTFTVTQATRLAQLNNGSIDIVCGHNPVNATSLQQTLLSHATLVTAMRAMTTREREGLTLSGIGGLRVGTTVGGQAIGRLRAYLRQHALQVTPVPGRNVEELWGDLEKGRSDVLLLPDAYLLAARARAAMPAHYVLVEGVLGHDPVALAFRHGDEALAAIANQVIAGMMRSGEMAQLHRKWFFDGIPDAERGLQLELSPATRGLFDDPGSEMQAL